MAIGTHGEPSAPRCGRIHASGPHISYRDGRAPHIYRHGTHAAKAAYADIFLFAANNSKYPNIKFYAEVYTKKANETLNFNLEAKVENEEEKEADLI